MRGHVTTPAPAPLTVSIVMDSLGNGALDGGADWPYLLTGMLGQRSEARRGWTAADRPLVPVGGSYAAVTAFGAAHRCTIVPGSTAATAVANAATVWANYQRAPSDIVFGRGLNDLSDTSAVDTLALIAQWHLLARAAYPSARLWHIVPWALVGAGQSRLDLIAGLVAGQAGADVSLIDWRDHPAGAVSGDGVHQTLPASQTNWATWLGPQAYQSTMAWCARRTLESLYGTHVPGTWCATRSLSAIAGDEVYP